MTLTIIAGLLVFDITLKKSFPKQKAQKAQVIYENSTILHFNNGLLNAQLTAPTINIANQFEKAEIASPNYKQFKNSHNPNITISASKAILNIKKRNLNFINATVKAPSQHFELNAKQVLTKTNSTIVVAKENVVLKKGDLNLKSNHIEIDLKKELISVKNRGKLWYQNY
jgi:LPS export ABC transporter protein LptC